MPADPPQNGRSAPIGFLIAGSEMASSAILGLLLDYALGTTPGFTIGLTLFGCLGAFLQLKQMAKAFAAKDKKSPQNTGGSGGESPGNTGGSGGPSGGGA